MKSSWLPKLLSLFLLLTAVGPASADVLETQLLDYNPYMWGDTEIDGDWIAVGRNQLYAVLYKRGGDGTWAQHQVLSRPADVGGWEYWSYHMSLSGDTLAVAVGSYDSPTGTDGGVWIYQRDAGDQWNLSQLITVSSPHYGHRFGHSVALDGDTLAVGSYDGLYVFERDGAGLFQQVQLIDEAYTFPAVDVSGSRIVAGDSDSARIYEKGASWGFVTEIVSPEGSNEYVFGRTVALDGDTLVVGDSWWSSYKGAIYVFERDGAGAWNHTFTRTGKALSEFGAAIDVDGDRIVVGAPREYNTVEDAGNAYTYVRTGGAWAYEETLGRSGTIGSNEFGLHVAVRGDEVLATGSTPSHYYNLAQPFLVVDADGPACSATATATISADVAGSLETDSVAYSVNGGTDTYVCIGCGQDPSLSFNASLDACDNTVSVTATDTAAGTASDSVSVRFDGTAPALSCDDIDVDVPFGTGSATVTLPSSATDTCDGSLAATCDHGSSFPVGSTSVACSATDTCGNVGSCTFTVTVNELPDPGQTPTGCELFDFRDEVGGETPYVTKAALGDAIVVHDWRDVNGTNIYAQTSDLYHGNDNAGFYYRDLAGYGDFRVETPLPEIVDYTNSEYQKGGLMVRYGLDPLAARVMIMHAPAYPGGGSIQFDVRTVAGATATEMASTISSAGVDRLAIEKQGDLFVVEVSYDDGATWMQPLGALGGEATLTTTGNALAGMAVASYDLSNDVGFNFPELEVCGEDEVPPPPPIEPVDGCLSDPFDDGYVDSGWALQALGDADQVSVAETDVLQLSADGSSLFSSGTDHGGFLYREVTGDFRVETEVDVNNMAGTGAYRKGGLMLRAGLAANAVRFIAQLAPSWNNTGTTSLQFRYRGVTGARGDLTWASNRDNVSKNVHLAIERQGQTITAYYSLDGGSTWVQPVGGAGGAVTLGSLPDTLYVGLNTVSYDTAEAVTTEFDDFALCSPASVGGVLWWDQDTDGVVGEGEPLLDNVQMELRTLSNQPIFTVYTDDDGRYLFPNVDPGDYRLLIDSATGMGIAYEGTVDPDGADTFEWAIISVAPGQQYLDADFGFRGWFNWAGPGCDTDDFEDGVFGGPEWWQTTMGDADQITVVEQNGGLSISGDGSSLYTGSDNGAYVFQHYHGDFRVEVDVDGTGMTTGGLYRKAGLLVRTGFGFNDPRYMVQLIPYWENGTAANDSVVQFRYRETQGGQSDIAWGSNIAGVPRQLRLAIERVGDTLTAQYSTDGGVTWSQPAGGAQGSTTNPALPDTLLVGLNVVSYDANTASTAVFDNYQVCD